MILIMFFTLFYFPEHHLRCLLSELLSSSLQHCILKIAFAMALEKYIQDESFAKKTGNRIPLHPACTIISDIP